METSIQPSSIGWRTAAVRMMNERIDHCPTGADKAWEAAKNLAYVYQRDRKQLDEIVKLLDRALENRLLTIQQIAGETSYQSLRATEAYTALERKYAKN